MLVGLLIAISSVTLNFLLVYLAAGHFMQIAHSLAAKRRPHIAHAIWFANSIIMLGVICGSFLYFTLGAESVFELTKGSHGPAGFGEWPNVLLLTNVLVDAIAAGIVVRRFDKFWRNEKPN